MKLGALSALGLLVAGGGVALWRPGWRDGRLTHDGRTVLAAWSRAVLDGLLPTDPGPLAAELDAQLVRLVTAIGAFPRPVQDELGLLLSLLASAPGRIALAGLHAPWAEAAVADVQQSLQTMRLSSMELKQQAYRALRDLCYAAYCAEPSHWAAMGYPGPITIVSTSP